MKKVFLSKKSEETAHIGKLLAEKIIKEVGYFKSSDMVILELIGDLGGGKTTFLKGFALGLNIKEKISSPTFIIAKSYRMGLFNNHIGYKNKYTFCHVDAYRLNDNQGPTDLDLKNFIFGSHKIVAIEWAEKIKKIMPKNTIKIKFVFVDKNLRKITMFFPKNLAIKF